MKKFKGNFCIRFYHSEISVHYNKSLKQIFITIGKRHFFSNRDDSTIKREDVIFWKRYKFFEFRFY